MGEAAPAHDPLLLHKLQAVCERGQVPAGPHAQEARDGGEESKRYMYMTRLNLASVCMFDFPLFSALLHTCTCVRERNKEKQIHASKAEQ